MEICSTPINTSSSGYATFCSSAGAAAAVAAVATNYSTPFQSPPASATRPYMPTEAEVLEQVSRMTIDNREEDNGDTGTERFFASIERMAFPMSPAINRTPVLRKRKTTLASVVPSGSSSRSVASKDPLPQFHSKFLYKKPRAVFPNELKHPQPTKPPSMPIPMFPDTPTSNDSKRPNVFSQHRPLFSPIERTSHVNMEFLAVLQSRYQQHQQQTVTPPSSRRKVGTILCDCFPSLDELDSESHSMEVECNTPQQYGLDTCQQTQQTQSKSAPGIPPARKILKMRPCIDEFALLASQSGL